MQRLYTFLLLFQFVAASAQQREMEIWNLNQVSLIPSRNLSLKVSEKLHYSTIRSDLQLKYAELKVGYKPKRWMEYGGSYRLTTMWMAEDYWETENRVMLHFDIQQPIHHFILSVSNRIEYRDFKHLSDHFRHRQSLRVDLPPLASWGLRFYFSEESFYKFTEDKTHLARVYAGITVLDKKHLNISTYYALQKDKFQQNWFSSDVLGLNFNLMI